MIAQPEARGELDARPTNGDARKRTTSAATNVDGGQRIAFRAQMPAPLTQPFPLTTFCFSSAVCSRGRYHDQIKYYIAGTVCRG